MKRLHYSAVSRLVLVCICSLLLLFFSCGDDDGPSTRELLVGTWNLDKIDGESFTSADGFFTLEIEADGDFELTGFIESVAFFDSGEWELVGNEIRLEYDGGDEEEIDLVSVTSTRLILEIEGDDWEFEKD